MIIQNRAPQLPHFKHEDLKLVGRGTFSAVYRDLTAPRTAYIVSYYGDESKSIVERVRATTRSRHLPHYDIMDEFDTERHGRARMYRTQYYEHKMHYKHHFLQIWNEAHDKAVALAERSRGLTDVQFAERVNDFMAHYRHFSPSIMKVMQALAEATVGTDYMFDKATTHNFRLNSTRAVAIMIDPIFHRGLIKQWRERNDKQHKVRRKESASILALSSWNYGSESSLGIGSA